MTKNEALRKVNDTIDMIRDTAINVNSELEAGYVANELRQYLNQLDHDIHVYELSEEEY